MTIAQKAAVLLGVDYEANSALLDMLAEMVMYEVLDYCNNDSIPST